MTKAATNPTSPQSRHRFIASITAVSAVDTARPAQATQAKGRGRAKRPRRVMCRSWPGDSRRRAPHCHLAGLAGY